MKKIHINIRYKRFLVQSFQYFLIKLTFLTFGSTKIKTNLLIYAIIFLFHFILTSFNFLI